MREATGGYENPSLTTFEFRASCAVLINGSPLPIAIKLLMGNHSPVMDVMTTFIYIYIGCGPLRVTVANEGL